jgi:hypothetical protein
MAQVDSDTSLYHADLNAVLDAVVVDLTNIRSALNTLVTKLNADTGVGDSNYAAATALTTTVD